MSNSILLLEDDPLFALSLIDLLEEEGYSVAHVTNAQAALDITYKRRFELYLLDINVPIMSGTALLKELRLSKDKTPAIFVTSHTDKEKLKEGFLCGGDDYITKPFDNDELLLRIKALLVRTYGDKECQGSLCHESDTQRFIFNGQELALSKKEYELLLLLFQNADKVVAKEQINDTLWSSSQGVSDGALRVYINRLRELLGEERIQNIRSRGYKLVCNA